jgi:predicted GH43/DUF377 family glycosyl hydrolase
MYPLSRPHIQTQAKEVKLDPSLGLALSQTGLMQTVHIKIPYYPKAFNPSLIPYEEGYLLSFRVRSRFIPLLRRHLSQEEKKSTSRKDDSFIGVVKLDKNLKVSAATVQLLNLFSYASEISSTAEDARLLKIENRIFIFFNDLPPAYTKGGFAMYFGELVEEGGRFVLKEPAKLLKYAQAIPIEKNWTPFISDGKLYLIYSDQPRTILEVDWNTGHCTEVVRSRLDWNWNWGQIRGGTPACLVEGKFVTVFHSNIFVKSLKQSNQRNYVMGMYTFDEKPPFTVRQMTAHPLGRLVDYTEENDRKVIFPGGLIIAEDVIYVAWGKNDKQVFITTFNKKVLLESLTGVPSAESH